MQKAHSGTVRGPWTTRTAATNAAHQPRPVGTSCKSLFRNILPVTSLHSRFCAARHRSIFINPNEINILANRSRKNREISTSCKSLFGKMLQINSLNSRFCEAIGGSISRNPNKLSILRNRSRKNAIWYAGRKSKALGCHLRRADHL